ncbi:hypothetical protein KJS94_15530 [Flavihumibacter rivuli]|uniref:hypothetical protein n=1 Tax=Flavihumibacter rivuli TaxID=2838156 RepID=UPI001BDF55F8|nr:hypothetical protein [Flavihumibacter rivuli]ULQ56059.1 hypothetical protein KJS94_15530 [Flavihumibacter rivuli]
MLNLIQISRQLVLLASVAFLFTSCDKDDPAKPANALETIVVDLQGSMIDAESIDSAKLVLQKTGSNTPRYQNLNLAGNKLEATINGLTNGEWKATVYIYTDEGSHELKTLQYVGEKTINTPFAEKQVVLKAPTAIPATGWKRRIQFNFSPFGMTITVGEDGRDPYFSMVQTNPNWNSYRITRTIMNTTGEEVAKERYECIENNCLPASGVMENDTFFRNYSTIATNNSWTRSHVEVRFGNRAQQSYVISEHEWTK